ncbi:hypothetical protein L580_4310 [Serratia fonticola AU-P3(3)]|nr:hypothetical protein L580_4310 [Serratia fonticola AU-P3(3)]
MLLADSSKYIRCLCVTPLASLTDIVTDKALPETAQRQLADLPCGLHLA